MAGGTSRDKRIEILGYDEVRRREAEYKRKYRTVHKIEVGKGRGDTMEFHQSLITEGYGRTESAKIAYWIRNEWKKKDFDKSLCRCRDGFKCAIHHLDHLREMIVKESGARV